MKLNHAAMMKLKALEFIQHENWRKLLSNGFPFKLAFVTSLIVFSLMNIR